MNKLINIQLKKYLGHHLYLWDGLIFTGTFFLLLGHAVTDWPISGDGTRYLAYSKSFAGEMSFNPGYYEPPLYPFLTYLLHFILPGTWEFHGRFISVLSATFLIVIVFRFVRKIFDLKVALVCSSMLISYRFFLRYGAETQTESLLFLLMLIHIILVYNVFIDITNLKYWLGLVVSSLFLMLTKGSGVLIILWSMAVLAYALLKMWRNWKLLGIVLISGIGVSILSVVILPDIVDKLLKMATRINAFDKTFLFFAQDGYFWWLKDNAFEKHSTIWTGIAFLSGMGIFKLFSSNDKRHSLFGFLLVSLMLYLVITAGSFYGLITYKPFYVRYNVPAGILAVLLAGFGIVGLADQVVSYCSRKREWSKTVARLLWSSVAVGCVGMCFLLDSFHQNVEMLHRLSAGKIVNEYRVAGEWMLEHYPGDAIQNFASDSFVSYYANAPAIKNNHGLKWVDTRDQSQEYIKVVLATSDFKFVVIDEEWIKDRPGYLDLVSSEFWTNHTELLKRFDIKSSSAYINHAPLSVYRWLPQDRSMKSH